MVDLWRMMMTMNQTLLVTITLMIAILRLQRIASMKTQQELGMKKRSACRAAQQDHVLCATLPLQPWAVCDPQPDHHALAHKLGLGPPHLPTRVKIQDAVEVGLVLRHRTHSHLRVTPRPIQNMSMDTTLLHLLALNSACSHLYSYQGPNNVTNALS